jgi:endonuclease/exonuclease/phosphatase family metal-dependent hydrolase
VEDDAVEDGSVAKTLRVMTFNLLTVSDAAGHVRQDVVRRILPELRADIVALQEVTRAAGLDQAAELLGREFTVVDLPGRAPNGSGECLACRWPIGAVSTLDVPIAGAAHEGIRATAVAVEVLAPSPFGPLLAVHHRGAYQLHLESARERQALATARFVEDLVRDRDELPVVLLGDLNAAPDAASIRFLTGKQTLAGASVRYEDAWVMARPDDPGHTFTPRNPLVRGGQMPLERGRRIDYILIRSGSHGPPLDVDDCRLVFTEPVDGVWASDHFGVLAELRLPSHRPGHWADDPGPVSADEDG